MSTSDLVKSVWVDTLQNIPFGSCQQLVRRTTLTFCKSNRRDFRRLGSSLLYVYACTILAHARSAFVHVRNGRGWSCLCSRKLISDALSGSKYMYVHIQRPNKPKLVVSYMYLINTIVSEHEMIC